MDVFRLREGLVRSYQAYTAGFLEIRDDEIRDYVKGEIGSGLLWPDPKVQLNPAFEPGPWIHELVADGTLHEEAGADLPCEAGPA